MFQKFPYLIKKYSDDKYRIVVFKSEYYNLPKAKREFLFEGVDLALLQKAGIQLPREKWIGDIEKGRWESNLCRAVSKIKELGYCNDWELFGTFTLDKKKYDRDDLPKFQKDLTQFIRDFRKTGYNVKYLLIPELHEDKTNWHMHGFFMGLPLDHLKELTLYMKLPKDIREMLQKGIKVYTWDRYSKKFGYITFTVLRTKDQATSYITKYVAKGIKGDSEQVEKIGKGNHLYYASVGLKKAENVREGAFSQFEFNRYVKDNLFESDFCFTSWLDSEQAKTFLK